MLTQFFDGFLSIQYPLQDGVLEPGVSLGISNELDAEEGSVSLKAGYLLVLRTRD